MARKIILAVIILASVSVAGTTIFLMLNTPEQVTTRKIEEIARDYYENYYYSDVLQAKKTSGKTLGELLEKYTERGLQRVDLEQLLLFKNGKHKSSEDMLKRYCDEERTNVQFFPEAPYGRTDYRMEIKYSCNF